MSDSISIKNKKASYLYEFVDKLIAGIQLFGTEIKSIRNSKASINEAYCVFVNGELIVRSMHISPYEMAGHYNHEAKRDRKLLLNRKELDKWESKLKTQGLTIIPTKLFINKNGMAKLEVALSKGKKLHDKREDLKTKDAKREVDRLKSNFKKKN